MHRNNRLKDELKSLSLELKESEVSFDVLKKIIFLIWEEVRRFDQSSFSSLIFWLRQQSDSWRCQVEQEIHQNLEYQVLANKTIQLIESNSSNETIRHNIRRLAKLDSSVQDGEFGRYECGYLSKYTRSKIFELEEFVANLLKNNKSLEYSPKSWAELEIHLKSLEKIVQVMVTLFPSTHPFSSFPSSIFHSIQQITGFIYHQIQVRETIRVLYQTFDEEELNRIGSFFRYEIELLKSQVLPFPLLMGSDEV